jgi:hypothetical protein
MTAAAKLATEFSVNIDEESDVSGEDENSVPEDAVVRLKRLQRENAQLTVSKAVPVRRRRQDLDAPLTASGSRPADPRPAKRRRVPLDSAPQVVASTSTSNGHAPDAQWEPMDWVSTRAQSSLVRRKRRALDDR